MKNNTINRALLGLAISLAATLSAAAQTKAESRSITMVVGFGPGGGYDVYARMLARHLTRHLPGQPNIIVQNMPGASSLKAIKYLDNGAPKDETLFAATTPGLITLSLFEPEKIRFKFTDVAWLGSITRDLRACYAWAATGIKTWEDLKRAARFNIGAPAPGMPTYINAAILKNLFGVAVHHVTGYAGSPEQRLAVERGELDGDCGAWSSVPSDWISANKINPVIRFSPLPFPGLPEGIPFARDLAPDAATKELIDLLIAADTLGRPYVASKNLPADRLAMLRAAFDATMQDAAFLAEAQKLDVPVIGPVSGADAEKIVAAIYAAPPALVARAKAIAGE